MTDDVIRLIFFVIFALATISAVRAIVTLILDGYSYFQSQNKLSSIDRRMKERAISLFEGSMKRGDIYFSRGRNESAIDCYREAVRHHPLNKIAPFRLGLALFVDDCYRGVEVEETLQEALDKDGDYSDAHFILGQFYMELGLFTKAREELSKAPDRFDVGDFDFLFERGDEEKIGSRKFHYRVFSFRVLRTLFILYFVQFFLLATIFFTHFWGLLAINFYILIMQVRLQLSLYEQLVVEDEQLTYRTFFGSFNFRWQDIISVSREGDHRVNIVLRNKQIRISRQWQDFEEIIRKIKAQLYFTGWRHCLDKSSPVDKSLA
jgi:tetratricopeptide (TPR) repeat protein